MLAMRRESEQYTIYSSNNNNNQTNINLNINSSEISENNNNNNINNTSTNTCNSSGTSNGNLNGVIGNSTAASIVSTGLHQSQFYSSPFNFNGYGGAAYPSIGAFTGKVHEKEITHSTHSLL